MATMNLMDLYGAPSAAAPVPGSSTQVRGPNVSSTASGTGEPVLPAAGNTAAFTWLGMVLALVALRVFVEMGGRAS